jgi:hypothetical protein
MRRRASVAAGAVSPDDSRGVSTIRRALVMASASAGALALAGCGGSGSGTASAPPTLAPPPTPQPSSGSLADIASRMSAGQWIQIVTSGLTTSLFVDGANSTLDYMDKGCYDPIHRKVTFIGHAHYGDQRWHEFDEASGRWSNLPDPPWDTGGSASPPFIGHGYQHNTVDPVTGDLFYRQFDSNTIRWLRRSTGTWTTTAAAPNTSVAGGLEWLPTIGNQGGLVLFLAPAVHLWDKATGVWRTAANALGPSTYSSIALRSVPHGVVLIGGGDGSSALWKIDGAGRVTACARCPIEFGIGQTITTAEPVTGELLVIRSDSVAFRYAVGTDAWSPLSLIGAPRFGVVDAGSDVVAIPIAAYGVVMFLFGKAPAVWLYKHT